jgi:FAD/FMN-containing dehydrogenase
MPYVEVQKLLDPSSPWGWLNYWKAEIVPGLGDGVIDLNVDHGALIRSPMTTMFFQPLGGALARVTDEGTAISVHDASWVVHGIAIWETEAESEYELDWVRQWGDFMAPYVRPGVPLTFSADTGDDRVRATFGPEKYARLVALKDEYDPDNLFRLNQNIRPS